MLLFIQKMGWKNLVLVVGYENPLWNEAATLAQTLANQFNITVVSEITMASFDGLDPVKDYKPAIDQIRFSRGKLIYILSNPYSTMDFILACQHHGLSRKEYTFLSYNSVGFPDDVNSVSYWGKYGQVLNIAARKNLITSAFPVEQGPRTQWSETIFKPNLNGYLVQGPYLTVDFGQTGGDPTSYYPNVFYDSPNDPLPSESVFMSYDATNRLILAWQSVLDVNQVYKRERNSKRLGKRHC